MPPPPLPWRPPDEWSYAYLLGLYLGDGCLQDTNRSYQLVVVCTATYPEIIDDCDLAMRLTLLPRHVGHYPAPGCVRVTAASKYWPLAFPQHGPGRKHSRKIELADWQCEVVDRHPKQFLRGLIHSDGCRTVNRFKTKLPSGRVAEYEYVRYFFSNLSPDIRGLFCEYCERLGIRWTQSNHRNVSVSDRDSVALLDSFVGEKA